MRRFIGLSPKLCNKWDGPYYITDVADNNTVKLRRYSDNVELKTRINVTRLRPYNSPLNLPLRASGALFDNPTISQYVMSLHQLQTLRTR